MAKQNPSKIYYYNLNGDKIWEYDFRGDERKTEYNLLSFDQDVMYFSYSTHDNSDSNVKFQQIDVKTGALNFSYTLEDHNSEYNYSYTVKRNGNRTILTGKISPYRTTGYNYQNAVGLFKIVLDEKGNEIFKKHFLWEEANDFIEMSKKGKLEKGYRLYVQSYFVFKDERIVVLSEKFKDRGIEMNAIEWGTNFSMMEDGLGDDWGIYQ